jgi:hypothetical protein
MPELGVRQSYPQIKNSQGPFAEFLDGRGIAQDFPPPRPINPLPPHPACLKRALESPAQAGARSRRSHTTPEPELALT